MWWWVVIWVLLVVIAAAYLASRAWGVWGQFKELTAEVRRSSDTVAALQAQTNRLGDRRPAPQPDVFGDPRQLRREREVTRASLKQQRRARQAARRPSWARHLD
ncbi:hypothetical protein BJ986_002991 [Phycicoccus badiiscoriae]|uniref:Uncharacterized protein n=1 Tax=Pedococcus badiiscoriae TaxID=642776 RepID=A0A852WNR3_9MICO|nr:hypothetical protein [Pedococcus badiiscoriae]NYG08504.1 hypothetical protein [Pedococcus badiiscoriae]